MSVESWKAVCDWLAVVFVGFTFMAGAGALITGRILSTRQEAQLRQFNTDLTKAKTDLVGQQERAAKAEGLISEAGQHAAEANAKAEGFRLGIAKANESAAKAEAQVASATAESATAKLETEKLKAVVAWRTLSPEATTELETFLSKKPGSVNLRYTDGDPESLYLAIQYSNILRAAKWKVATGANKFSGALLFGVALPDAVGVDAQTLRAAFSSAKVPFATGPMPPIAMSIAASSISGAPTLMIGSRNPIAP